MVKLRCMGKMSARVLPIKHAYYRLFLLGVLRSVNARFTSARWVALGCDFNLTTVNEVDYSFTQMIQVCGAIQREKPGFFRRLVIVLQTIPVLFAHSR
jgi:hypothetical protein